MSDQVNGQNENIDKTGQAGRDGARPSCEPGCTCGAPGPSTRCKIIVCLVVGLAVAAVLARSFIKKAESEKAGAQQAFATALPVAQAESASPASETAKAAEEEQKKSTLWGNPLDSLASLNDVAAEKDAVFVFVTTGKEESLQAARKEIESAASKITSRGTTMAAYILKKDTRDYAQVTSEIPAPCVLAMVKGRGMSVVNDITEGNLIQALVMASRPSGCCPSGGASAACP